MIKNVLCLIGVSIGLWLLLTYHLDFPKTYQFDEAHYVPAAKTWLESGKVRNWEHPPLGKYLIALSITLFGDKPQGWRMMSVFFGIATLWGVFFVSYALFNHAILAWLTFFLTLSNHFVYVHARIAMLDTFMVAFLVWAIGFLTFAVSSKNASTPKRNQALLLSGVFFGLSLACKWSGLYALSLCLVFLIVNRLITHDRWIRLPVSFSIQRLVISLVCIPVGIYLLTYVSLLMHKSFSLINLIQLQLFMLKTHAQLAGAHPYASAWNTWPLMIRPIWYTFEEVPPDSFRGVFLVGNPIIIYLGLILFFYTLSQVFIKKCWRAALICLFYVSGLYSWAFVPRGISFFYYYYFSTVCLGFCIVYFMFDLIQNKKQTMASWLSVSVVSSSALLFCYFFPVLSGLQVEKQKIYHWVWFAGWM